MENKDTELEALDKILNRVKKDRNAKQDSRKKKQINIELPTENLEDDSEAKIKKNKKQPLAKVNPSNILSPQFIDKYGHDINKTTIATTSLEILQTTARLYGIDPFTVGQNNKPIKKTKLRLFKEIYSVHIKQSNTKN